MTRYRSIRLAVFPTMLLAWAVSARADDKLPPPPNGPTAVLRNVRRAYSDEIRAATTPSAKAALAAKMVESIRESTPSDDRYGLIAVAIDLAVEGGSVAVATRATKTLVTSFDVDPWDGFIEAYVEAADNARDAGEIESGIWIGFQLTQQLIEAQRYDDATDVSRAAIHVAKRTGSRLVAQIAAKNDQRARTILRAANRIASARAKLAEDPNDPAACSTVGLFRCVHEDNWEAGLALLARGSELELRQVARRDLEISDSPEERIRMGDTWWEIGEQQPRVIREAMRFRAAIWYLRARGQVEGLKRKQVEDRIKLVPLRFGFVLVKAHIDGTDELRIYDEQAVWGHGDYHWPTNVTINGIEWDVRSKSLPNTGQTRFMPHGIDLTTAKIIRKKGRVKLSTKKVADHFVVYMHDPVGGAGETEFLIQFGPFGQ